MIIYFFLELTYYGGIMGASKIIKHVLLERNVTVKYLADKLGIETQSMNNKLYRDTFSFKEIVKIADILNCDVKVITRDTGKEFWDDLEDPMQKVPETGKTQTELKPSTLPTEEENPRVVRTRKSEPAPASESERIGGINSQIADKIAEFQRRAEEEGLSPAELYEQAVTKGLTPEEMEDLEKRRARYAAEAAEWEQAVKKRNEQHEAVQRKLDGK
jgi:DNA-binding Xre family transcriptional regulator/uncharacterized protein YnzC (UPF0291/DUF896 family)